MRWTLARLLMSVMGVMLMGSVRHLVVMDGRRQGRGLFCKVMDEVRTRSDD